MSELRKDPLVDRWVIISARRGKRPSDFQSKGDDPGPDTSCAFCPGREHETGPEVCAVRDSEHADPNTPGWKVRIIHNKFPAVSPDSPQQDGDSIKPCADEGGVYSGCVLEGFGSHEVVIETPDHITTFAGLPVDHSALIFKAFRSRIQQFRADPRFRACQVFKNHGNKAGASMRHTHSQILAMPVVPRNLQTQMEGAECFYQNNNRKCALCLTLRDDCSVRQRVIDENETFLSAAPFAPRFPYETWIIPKRHGSDFDSIEDVEVEGLANIMKLTLQKMDRAFTCPPYNYMLHTAPLIPEYRNVPYYHWHIQIVPHLVEMGGFELGSGCHINSVFPERAAALLRSTVV